MTTTDAEKFWSKVNKTENCWEWTGSLYSNGYGKFKLRNRGILAHRYSYYLANDYPGKLCVLHRCDNRLCVRPDHLFLGTPADNAADAASKGRLRTKLTEQSVITIREQYANGGISQRELARKHGVGHRAIRLALLGYTWRHIQSE